jgi:hypothetical protein
MKYILIAISAALMVLIFGTFLYIAFLAAIKGIG